jgi:hypothetical protein
LWHQGHRHLKALRKVCDATLAIRLVHAIDVSHEGEKPNAFEAQELIGVIGDKAHLTPVA